MNNQMKQNIKLNKFIGKVMDGNNFNSLFGNKTFYKLTNKSECHNGFTFKTGLNVDTMPFNPTSKCQSGGIYFCEKDKFHKWLNYNNDFMCWYREVSIPSDAQLYIEKSKIKVDKLILSERKSIVENMIKIATPYDKNECSESEIIELMKNKLNKIRAANLEIYTIFVSENPDKICCVITDQKKIKHHIVSYAQYADVFPDTLLTDELLIHVTTHNPSILKCIHTKQTEEMCIIAVKQNWYNLKYVKAQTEKMCIIAIEQDWCALEYVKVQTERICTIAVEKYWRALQYVKIQTERMCTIAIEQNGLALKLIKVQTDAICAIAVEKCWQLLEYVKVQTDVICTIAIEQHWCALKYVKIQTDVICAIAVEKWWQALEHVKVQTEQICIIAIKKCWRALKYVKIQTEEMCTIAVEQNWCSLKYIKVQTEEMCAIAIKQNHMASKYVRSNDSWEEHIIE